jgi:hypothetical protein
MSKLENLAVNMQDKLSFEQKFWKKKKDCITIHDYLYIYVCYWDLMGISSSEEVCLPIHLLFTLCRGYKYVFDWFTANPPQFTANPPQFTANPPMER